MVPILVCIHLISARWRHHVALAAISALAVLAGKVDSARTVLFLVESIVNEISLYFEKKKGKHSEFNPLFQTLHDGNLNSLHLHMTLPFLLIVVWLTIVNLSQHSSEMILKIMVLTSTMLMSAQV